jgi:hypothetical protein
MLKQTIVVMLLACGVGMAQPPRVITEKGKDHFETQFSPGGRLKLEARSGELRVTGTDSHQISVHFEGRRASEFADVEVQFRPTSDGASLKVSGGPRDEFAMIVEIPRETDLFVRMPFGDLHLRQVRGSKDVAVHAGEVTIDMGDPKDYAQIEASVTTGELDAGAMGVSKGGLFRSFHKDGPGKYRLYAHVGSGQLNLN